MTWPPVVTKFPKPQRPLLSAGQRFIESGKIHGTVRHNFVVGLTKLKLALFCCALCCLVAIATAQTPNPVAEAVRNFGKTGLKAATAPKSSPTAFKPSPDHPFLTNLANKAGLEGAERKGFLEQSAKAIDKYPELAIEAGLPVDDCTGPLALLAFAAINIVKGDEPSQAAALSFIESLHAALDKPSVRNATDAQKQLFYDECMFRFALYAAVISGALPEDLQESAKGGANDLLFTFFGVGIDAFVVTDDTALILSPAELRTMYLAPGLNINLPSGWKDMGAYYQRETKVVVKGKEETQGCRVYILKAVRATGNKRSAILKQMELDAVLGCGTILGELVFSARVGNQLAANFLVGNLIGPEPTDMSACSLYMVDCVQYLQPILVTQYNSNPAYWDSEDGKAPLASLSETTKFAVEFLAGLQHTEAQGRPLTNVSELSGSYFFGQEAHDIVSMEYFGMDTPPPASTNGTLNLKPDSSFSFASSGESAKGKPVKTKGSGKWSLEGDILVLKFAQYDDGSGPIAKEVRYKFCGATATLDGRKCLVLMPDVNAVPSLTTLARLGLWLFSAPPK